MLLPNVYTPSSRALSPFNTLTQTPITLSRPNPKKSILHSISRENSVVLSPFKYVAVMPVILFEHPSPLLPRSMYCWGNIVRCRRVKVLAMNSRDLLAFGSSLCRSSHSLLVWSVSFCLPVLYFFHFISNSPN